MDRRTYIAIDLKSFYASVECVERGLDPMTTHLVVADESRTDKTICLAVSPPLKACGVPGRPRLFEVKQRAKELNTARLKRTLTGQFSGSSWNQSALEGCPTLALDFIVAPPRMALYMEYSTRIYQIYLKYMAPEDIHVYSIDEVFLDATPYLATYKQSARQLTMKILLDVLETTGITATAGIGTNLYLAKVAMDIMAKRIPPDKNGVRIAELNELRYRQALWEHRPLTDFWRVGKGYARRLEALGLYTMGDIARCSLGRPDEYYNETLLYDLFGVNAELLIDHAWGWEPCTIADIKAYRPASSSMGAGQVLHRPYSFEKARLVLHEMADQLALDLVAKQLMTNQLVLTVSYDIENLKDPNLRKAYHGPVTTDHYGRSVPKHAHGTANLETYSSSSREIVQAVLKLYDSIVNPKLLVRRLNLAATHMIMESDRPPEDGVEQLDLFTDYGKRAEEEQALERERVMQETLLSIRKKYGKNAILKGMNLEEGATAMDRNRQIGGHKA